MKFLSKSVPDTAKIVVDFLQKVQKYKNSQAVVVGLFGDLGSGKTTFTQAVGKYLGVKEIITSPTFVIEKIYLLKDIKKSHEEISEIFTFERLIHIDAYRLESGQELLNLDFEDLLADPKNLILIEWPERVMDALPPDLVKINFKFISESEREIDML